MKPGVHLPRGYLLVEALCALALSGVLALSAALALGSARRSMASAARLASAERSGREAVSIIAALLHDSRSVTIEGDTAASLSLTIAMGAVCARDGMAILLPPTAVGSGTALTARGQPVEVGDLLSILVVDSLALGARWEESLVDSVTVRTTASPCGSADGWGLPADDGSPRLRLVLRDSLPGALQAGAPVRVSRRGRVSLYESGTGDWMIGWRRCADVLPSGVACGVIQPVAGPLRGPGSGLQLSVDSTAGLFSIEAAGLPPARPTSMTVWMRDGS
ncbi:MAG TPA: hypothetical protein VM764_02830 [Gemmatimonadaceae bacterium]|nr:hypothetical protein [Gemmatimonadaceae bacterium]